MGKELSEMTLEELWELFPVSLTGPSDKWVSGYQKTESLLKEILRECPVERISHIGSTAIHGIWAKDIVDILIEISVDADIETAAKKIGDNGFIRMSSAPGRISFNRGYTKEGFAENVCHVHLRYAGDNDELYFRDYLNEHPQVAKDYELLKLLLWKMYEHDRDAYTDAKTAFVKTWTAEAKKIYNGRYRPAGISGKENVILKIVTDADKDFVMSVDRHMDDTGYAGLVYTKSGYVIWKEKERIGIMVHCILWGHLPFLNLIFIKEEYRRKGFAKQAISDWETEMKQRGYQMTLISTQADEGAQHLYRKLGYLDCGGLVFHQTPLDQPMELFFRKVLG